MSKRLVAFVVVTLALVALSVYFLFCRNNNELSNKEYIERIASVKLPVGTIAIEEFDNGEFIAGGKYLLDSISIPQFIEQHHLRKAPPYFAANNFLDAPNRINLEQATQLFYFEGCKPGNNWMFIVNSQTGELWISVQYPDMAGDAPPCDESKMEHNISNQVKLSGKGNVELQIVDTILALPEFKERANYVKEQSKGKRHFAVLIAAEPDSTAAYYWVKAGEDNGDAFVTHFHFFVYPNSMRIMYYDPVEDAELSLEEWRGRQNSN